MAAISKVIGARATTFEKVFWRSLVCSASILCSQAYGRAPGPKSWWPKNPGVVLLRGVCGHLAILLYLESVGLLPLGVAVFLGKILPLAAAIFAWLFLGEPLRRSRLVALLVSLGGVALIARPAPGDVASSTLLGVALALGSGVFIGGALCCARALAEAGEGDMWLLLSLPLVSLPCAAPSAFQDGLRSEGRGQDVWWLFLALG